MMPQQPNQSLIDGIECLQLLASAGRPVGVTELSRMALLEKTRVHRILRTFAELGLTQQLPSRKYTVGSGIHVMSALAMFASGLIRRAFGPLESLRSLGHTVALGVLWRDQVSYLYHSPPDAGPGEGLGRIGLFPASSSSIGQLLLANQDESAVRALYEGHQIDGYPGGVDVLLEDLRRARARGYAKVITDTCQSNDDVTIAVGISSPPQAAIALAGTIDSQELPQAVAKLHDAARSIDYEASQGATKPR